MTATGGGEGVPTWIVTYSDMVTLLITFFIVLATFGNRETGQLLQQYGGSLIGKQNGTGQAGPRRPAGERNQIAVRLFSATARNAGGTEVAPAYADPSLDWQQAVLQGLLADPPGSLTDSYEMDLPLALLFAGEQLSEPGQRLLLHIATHLEKMPYEIQVQVSDPDNVPLAARVARFLFDSGKVAHTRLGVGLRRGEPGLRETVRLACIRQP